MVDGFSTFHTVRNPAAYWLTPPPCIEPIETTPAVVAISLRSGTTSPFVAGLVQ
jgi:hypothetical protein